MLGPCVYFIRSDSDCVGMFSTTGIGQARNAVSGSGGVFKFQGVCDWLISGLDKD